MTPGSRPAGATADELRELVAEGWAGLAVHRVRSVLSGMGILFGVAAVIGILSIGEGARREQELLIRQLGILNFQIRNRDLPETSDTEEIRRKSSGLSRRDQAALAAVLPAAEWVGAARDVDTPELLPRPKDAANVRVIGADPAWLAGSNLTLTAGRPLTALDEQRAAPVAILGTLAARELFPAESALGQRVRVGATWLTVVGLFGEAQARGTIEGVDIENRDGAIVAPLSTVLGRLIAEDGDPELTEVQVTVRAMEHVDGHVNVARRLIERMHRGQDDVEVVVPLRLLEQSRAQQRLFNWVMGLIAGISLLVGGIGIMNIMLATVLERTREIGVRLAVGARPRDIAGLFLVEASLISLIGGALGVVAGFALSWAVATATGWSTAVSPWAVLLAFVLSVGEGLLFGWLPAQRAAGLPPVIAIRAG